jgi:hypothetical protein
MIKKIVFLSFAVLTAVTLFAKPAEAEAKSHCRRSSSVQLNVGQTYRNDAYVMRRYARPAAVPAAVYVPEYRALPYYTPVYAYPAPVYVEEVYVAPAPRPMTFGGLSFSWNFFK